MKQNMPKLFTFAVILALVFGALPAIQNVAAATPTELFFSEYIEGSSNNKAIEIYNGTGTALNLSTGGYNVQMYFNGNASAGLTINLAGTVVDGDVFVLAQSSANATILAQADQTNGSGWFNGDDAVVLRKGTTIIDVIGQIGFDPGSEWGTGLISTADNTLRRQSTICAGDPNGSDAFDPSTNWEGFATDTFGGLGSHTVNCTPEDAAPEVASSYPTDGATDFPIDANLSITFSEPVNVSSSWFTLVCSSSGTVTTNFSGGPTTFSLDPGVSLVDGETCTLTVIANQISDQDGNDPPDNMAVNFTVGFTAFDICAQPFTPIPAIQGSGATVALTGTRTTQGVVVGDYEGPSPALRGFFIQDPAGDSNPATSDGIFVFEGSNANTVSLGDVVRVTGTAGENQGQSQISVGTIVKCGTGTVTPTDVTFPVASADFLEQYEGMLVRLTQTMYVTEIYQLGRFGEVLLSSGGRLQQPTNVTTPGAAAQALQDANNLNQILIDDGSQTQNPDPILFGRGGLPLSASNTLRGGDTATNIVGMMTYTWGGNAASPNSYRIRPINALNGYVNFEPSNPRPTSVPEVGGTIKVVGMNVLNFFNTFADGNSATPGCFPSGTDADCRGASSQTEFDRQWPKTVAAIVGMDADVVEFNEIENDGYGPDSSIAFLVDKLNAATAPGTYAFIDADAGTGQVNVLGMDAIRVAMIYQPARVTPVGHTAVLNTDVFVNGGDDAARNRPSLLQAFSVNANGAIFLVNANHLKSKGSACNAPDMLDGQGNCNQVRVNAVTELMNWFATDPTRTGDPDILMLGDYNSYAKEDPITSLEEGGFTNLVESFVGEDAYSYVFDGQWGYLDHALGSATVVSQVTGVADYHIDSDEPSVLDYLEDFKSAGQLVSLYAPDQFRISDHDPVLIGLNPTAPGSVSINNIPASATYGGSFTPTFDKLGDGTVSVVSLTTDTCTVSAGVVSYVGAGLCTLQASITAGSDADGNNYFAATGAEQSFTIGKKTLTVTADDKSAQYSDVNPGLTFHYTLADFVSPDGSSDIDIKPTCSTTRQTSDPSSPPTYPITCSGGSDGNYAFSFIPGTFTVTKEDAQISFDSNNPAALQVTTPGGNLVANSLILKVFVQEKQPDLPDATKAPGNINNVILTVKLTPLSGGSDITLSCTSDTPAAGYNIKTFTCKNATALAVDTYDVTATVGGNYFTAVSAYDAFTVYDPSLGFATGGGWFYWPGTSDKTNFGFVMKYNKGGTSPKGSLVVVRHLADGTIVKLKSNALTALALSTGNGCGIATFSGKATYMRWDTTLGAYVTGGGNPFTVYARDCNNPGSGFDYFWIRSVGSLVMADPASSTAVMLGGGNIAVPHVTGKK